MRVIRTAAEMREVRRGISGSVALVATLGGIHAGHTAHMDTVRPLCDVVVGSLFLNPTQFGPGEDLSTYPADEAADLAEFEGHRVDIVFAPSVDEMYPPAKMEVPQVDPGPVASVLEGIHRPGHFNGVATVVARLFSIIAPGFATFGEKDAQQLRIIQHLNETLGLGIEIIPIPTVRESDGLAISSRNVNLSSADREAAKVLHRSLLAAKRSWDAGERRGDALRASMTDVLDREPLATTDYASIADFDTFQELYLAAKPARALVAVNIGKTRLIDNVLL
ncbi:MAG: pantoate--beta-alanine ligase, partial [Chloroflexi bacterium]|nr:pantoate--beta-alanine ligase [Chloroflexota bacterium]